MEYSIMSFKKKRFFNFSKKAGTERVKVFGFIFVNRSDMIILLHLKCSVCPENVQFTEVLPLIVSIGISSNDITAGP